MKMIIRFVLAMFFVVVTLAPQVSAQVTGGSLSGSISDPAGAVVPNATVAARNRGTNIERSVNTKEDGFYVLTNLLPGIYQITVSASGFANKVVSDVNVTVGTEIQLNLSLSVSGTESQVEVRQNSDVQLTTSSLMEVVDSTTIRQMPLNGRDWTQLAALQPGVTIIRTQPNPTGGRGQRGFGTQMTVGGARPQQNNYRVDGISINDYANGSPGTALGFSFGVETVAEFSVLTSNYPAEYGRSSGGVINAITRSGANSYHGNVYEFLRNSSLDARSFFDVKTPPFRRNQFGASESGRILRDKTFFFANYEGLRQSLGITSVDRVPSANARAGHLSTGDITVDPQVKPFLAFFPLPNGALLGAGDVGIYSFAGQQVSNVDFLNGRIDHNISASDTLFGSYTFERSETTQPDELNNKFVGFTTRRNFAAAEYNHVFSPQMSNAFRVGFHRDVAFVGQTPKTINPLAGEVALGFVPGRPVGAIQVTGLTRFSGGLGTGSFYQFYWNSIQAYDDAFLTRGIHSIKFGFGIERIRNNMFASNTTNGIFQISSLLNFLTNRPRLFSTAIPGTISPRDVRQTVLGTYIQDDIRLKPNLTINVGLRYEPTTVPNEAQGKIGVLRNVTDTPAQEHLGSPYFSNPTLRNFSPRVGISWDPFGSGRTAIRAGFGVYDNLPLPYLVELMTLFSAPFFQQAARANLPAATFPTGAFPLVAVGSSTLRYAYIEPKPPRSYVMQWNLNVQHELGAGFVGTAIYAGSRGVHQPVRVDDINIVLPTLTPQGYVWPTPAGSGTKLNPSIATLNGLFWGGDSYYQGMQLEIAKRLSRTLQIQANYTWSKSIDTGSATIAGDTFNNSESSLPWYDTKLIRGLSDFNTAHSLTVSSTWTLPKPRWSGPSAWPLSGWSMGGIYQATSGTPFSVIIGGDPLGQLSTDTTGSADVPDAINSPSCKSLVNPGNPINYIKTQCLAFPSPSTRRGNLGRNTLIGPGLSNLDIMLTKNNYIKRISENFNVQFRFEAFNALNHTNFAAPLNNNIIFQADGTRVAGAGRVDSVQVPGRQLQFALKLIW